MKPFKEVSNKDFDFAFHANKLGGLVSLGNAIYGTDYGTSYETLDKSQEYGHMIFKTKQEAEQWHGQEFKEAVK